MQTILVLRNSVQENQAVSESSLSHFFKISMKIDGSSFGALFTTLHTNCGEVLQCTLLRQTAWFSGTLPLNKTETASITLYLA